MARLGASWPAVWTVVASGAGIFLSVIAYTRMAGLRSFSKMSAFDFAMTIAVGSLMGSVTIGAASLLEGVIGLATLFAVQSAIAVGRRRSAISAAVDNEPVLLMDGPNLLHENLRRARITPDDVRGKLREANVLQMSQVRAVVLETTGDISVLHGEEELEATLLDGVSRGASSERQ